jgi:hypothetical protein
VALSRLSTVSFVFASILALTGVRAAAEEAAPAAAPAATPAATAPVQLPPWMTPEVIKATVAINMTDPQKPQFTQIVGDYVTAHFAMIQKEVKRGAPNLDMTIRSKDNGLVHQMDDKMHKVLTAEQWPAFEEYKKELRTALTKQ